MLEVTDVLDLIDHVVEQAGDDHRAMCKYVNTNDQPECIAARILFVAGAPVAELKAYPPDYIDLIVRTGRCSIEMSPEAAAVLATAQLAQDTLHTWGQARDQARHKATALHKTPHRELVLL